MLNPVQRDRSGWQRLASIGSNVGDPRTRESSTTPPHPKAARSLSVWVIIAAIWVVTLVITVGAVESLLILLK
jgi:hypothetical protein